MIQNVSQKPLWRLNWSKRQRIVGRWINIGLKGATNQAVRVIQTDQQLGRVSICPAANINYRNVKVDAEGHISKYDSAYANWMKTNAETQKAITNRAVINQRIYPERQFRPRILTVAQVLDN